LNGKENAAVFYFFIVWCSWVFFGIFGLVVGIICLYSNIETRLSQYIITLSIIQGFIYFTLAGFVISRNTLKPKKTG
jgi:hypothetical protein